MDRNFAIAILYKNLEILGFPPRKKKKKKKGKGISYRNGRNQAFDILYKDPKYEKLKYLVTY